MATKVDTKRERARRDPHSPRNKRKRTARARARQEAPHDYWRGSPRPVKFGNDHWQVVALRGEGRARLNLAPIIEDMGWDDASAILSGTATLRLPPKKLDLTTGHTLVCRHSYDGRRWRELWRMRIVEPNVPSARDGIYALTLADDLTLLKRSKDDFSYKKDKRHPHGWFAHEIVRDICRRYHVRIGHIPRCRTRIKSLVKKNASPFDVIVAAMLKEKTASGTKFRIGWNKGRLWITPLRRSRELAILGPTLIDAAYQSLITESLATVLSVHGTASSKKKGKKHKLTRQIVSRRAVQRYGYIHQKYAANDADTLAELIAAGKKQLAKLAKPKQTLTLTHPGIPTMRRGDALRVKLPDIDLQTVVFVTSVRHSISGGDYTMEITCGFSDPYRDKDAEDRKKKCDAARRRHRKLPKGCEGRKRSTKRPKPKKSRQRSERSKA